MHRDDRALVAAIDQVLHHRIADLAGLVGGADHRHGLRMEDAVHRLDDRVLVRAEAFLACLEIADDAGIDCGRAGFRREDGVEVELLDLREVVEQRRDLDEDRGERAAVDGFAAAHAVEHLLGLDRADHVERLRLVDRRQTESQVLQHFDEDTAETEGDELAERGIRDRADQRLGRARGQHLLDLDAFDLGVGLVLAGIGQDRVMGAARLVVALDADDHAAGIGLVQNVRRDDLHDDGIAHAAGEPGGLVGRLGEAFLGQRDVVGVADQLGLRGRQAGAAIGLDAVENLADRRLIRGCFARADLEGCLGHHDALPPMEFSLLSDRRAGRLLRRIRSVGS